MITLQLISEWLTSSNLTCGALLRTSEVWNRREASWPRRKFYWLLNLEGGSINFLLSSSRQRPARFSFLENSREFFFIFTSRSRSRAVSISLSLLEKEWRDFIFHFSLLEKSESYPYFTLFSRESEIETARDREQEVKMKKKFSRNENLAGLCCLPCQ